MNAPTVPRQMPVMSIHGPVLNQRSSKYPTRIPPTMFDEMAVPTPNANASLLCSESLPIEIQIPGSLPGLLRCLVKEKRPMFGTAHVNQIAFDALHAHWLADRERFFTFNWKSRPD